MASATFNKYLKALSSSFRQKYPKRKGISLSALPINIDTADI